jgi:hypothetical protein
MRNAHTCGVRTGAALRPHGMRDPPKDEVRMGHEVRYALEHAPRLEDECWEGDLGEIHADSGG